jgi:hypothetical protein
VKSGRQAPKTPASNLRKFRFVVLQFAFELCSGHAALVATVGTTDCEQPHSAPRMPQPLRAVTRRDPPTPKAPPPIVALGCSCHHFLIAALAMRSCVTASA